MKRPKWWTTDHWATPVDVVRELEREFGQFDLDPCATKKTAKASNYFTPREDGLKQRWRGRVFLDPPYSKPAPWLQKAIEEVSAGSAGIVVALLPSDVSTGWFHDLVKGRAEIRFWRGRIRFIGWQGTPIDRPRNGNILAIYRKAFTIAALFLLSLFPLALRAFSGVSPHGADAAALLPESHCVRPAFVLPKNSSMEVDVSQHSPEPESLENEPPLAELRAEEIRLRSKGDREKQSAEDEARGVIRATPGGPALKVCWSLNEGLLSS